MIIVYWFKNKKCAGYTQFYIHEDISNYVQEMLAYGFGLEIEVI